MNLIKKFQNLDKYGKIAVIIIVLGIVLRFSLAVLHSISGDACWQLSNARYFGQHLSLPTFEQFGRDEPFWAPPLFHIFAGLSYALGSVFSDSLGNLLMKLISPLLGSLSLIVFYLLAKHLLDRKIAAYALFFYTFIPLQIDYSIYSYVDGTVSFFSLLSVYLLLRGRMILSGISAGFAILSKYNGIFILPVIIFILFLKNKDKIIAINKSLVVGCIALALGSLWFIRNWLVLGNPVWPFLNGIFNGYESAAFVTQQTGFIVLDRLFDFSGLTTIYLGIFGVPDGNIQTLLFYPIQHLALLFSLWIIATIIFSIPFIIGLFSKNKNRMLLLIWTLSFCVLAGIYILNATWSVSRFLLPAFPAVALLWALGLEKMKDLSLFRYVLVLLILIACGFVFSIALKINLAAQSWHEYDDDFSWVQQNTPQNSILISSGQCISYYTHRQTYPAYSENIGKADYVWINQEFRLDTTSIIDDSLLQSIQQEGSLIYENEETLNSIYKIK